MVIGALATSRLIVGSPACCGYPTTTGTTASYWPGGSCSRGWDRSWRSHQRPRSRATRRAAASRRRPPAVAAGVCSHHVVVPGLTIDATRGEPDANEAGSSPVLVTVTVPLSSSPARPMARRRRAWPSARPDRSVLRRAAEHAPHALRSGDSGIVEVPDLQRDDVAVPGGEFSRPVAPRPRAGGPRPTRTPCPIEMNLPASSSTSAACRA